MKGNNGRSFTFSIWEKGSHFSGLTKFHDFSRFFSKFPVADPGGGAEGVMAPPLALWK